VIVNQVIKNTLSLSIKQPEEFFHEGYNGRKVTQIDR